MTGASARRAEVALGVAALVFYAVHAASQIIRGRAGEVVWICHLGALLIGAGLLTDRALPRAIGSLWLSLGTPLWIVDLMTHGEFLPTSLLTHGGGLAVAALAAFLRGFPPGAWWKALAAGAVVQRLTRLVTEPAANVNLAFSVPPISRASFPSYPAYYAVMLGVCAAVMFAAEWVFRRLGRGAPTRASGSSAAGV